MSTDFPARARQKKAVYARAASIEEIPRVVSSDGVRLMSKTTTGLMFLQSEENIRRSFTFSYLAILE